LAIVAAAAASWSTRPDSRRSTAMAWRIARSLVSAGSPCGSRCTTATAASIGKPNSRAASLSALAAAEPGGIRAESPPAEVALSGGRNKIASITAAAQPPTMRYRRLTTTKA